MSLSSANADGDRAPLTIQWYPGHIAKAERALQEQLSLVDVVLDVRDLRVPLATCHPRLQQWLGSKERLLVLNRRDMVPPEVARAWMAWFGDRQETAYPTNGQTGQGMSELKEAAKQLGTRMNQRRRDRGMRPRAVRAVAVGFPNVGKSALINRLLGRRVAHSARRPGVTRQLRWIRISKELELLDAPGIVPAKLGDREKALKLAICNDIGEAAYDNQRVAAAFVDLLRELEKNYPRWISTDVLGDRYGLDLGEDESGETYLHRIARERENDDVERAARQLLDGFRKGRFGPIPLELPPEA